MLRQSFVATFAVGLQAAAQSGAVITHHLTWQEVVSLTGQPVLNPNGVLEPGESALVSLSISFTPEVGSIYPGSSGLTVRALSSSFFEMRAWRDGSWSNLSVPARWDNSSATGIPATGWVQQKGRLVGPALLSQDGADPDTSNPVLDVWQGIWTPTLYAQHIAGFNTNPLGFQGNLNASKLWVADPNQPPGYTLAPAYTDVTPTFISFPVIPAPGAGLVLLCSGAMFAQRRR